MKIKKIIKLIEQDTNLFEKLLLNKKLSFIGEENCVNYLRDFISSKNELNYACEYEYLLWSDAVNDLSIIKQQKQFERQVIIVVSIKNENPIYETLKQYVLEQNLDIKILRLFSDIFINIMSHQELLGSCDYPTKPPERAYVIVTTPRSGSTFLCSLLQSTKIAGYPAEYFRQPSLILTQECHFDYVKYLRILMHSRVTENKVFGTKIMARFLRAFEKSEFDFQSFIKGYLSKMIYLNRIDKVAQAVSLLIAQKTNSWHVRKDKKHQEYQSFLNSIEISDADLENIDKTVKNLKGANKYLKSLFKKYNINSLNIDYEKFEVKPEAYIRQILEFLNISTENEIKPSSSLKKISSSLSQQIIMRYEQKYAEKLGEEHIKILKQLVKIYESSDKPEQGFFYYQRLAQLQPDNASFYFKLAKIEESQGNTQKAIQNYQKALSLNFSQPVRAYISLGDVLIKDGQIEKAISVYEKAIEIKPDNKKAAAKLAKIKIARA